MAVKVFIDGKEGTTGLKIFERFAKRPVFALRCTQPKTGLSLPL